MKQIQKTKLTISILLLTIGIQCAHQAMGQELPRLKIAPNQRYLMTENGDPFFWLGDTGWLLFSKLDRVEADQYLSHRAQNGFNVIQVMLLHQLDAVNAYGDSALVQNDISKPRTTAGSDISDSEMYDYWDHVEYIIDLAAQKGLYMALVPVWGSNVKSGKVLQTQAHDYALWLAERYGSKSNIIWLNGGDVRGSDSTAVWNEIGQTLNSQTKHQLITFHPFGRTQSSKWFHDAKWLDFNMFQSGHRRYDQDDSELGYGPDNWKYVRDDYGLSPTKPTIDGEPSYEGIPQGLHNPEKPFWNANDVRRYAYWSVFAGAFGFSYGHSAVMQMHKPNNPNPAYGVREVWTDALDAPGALQMIHLKKLMESKSFFDRIPDQSILAENRGAQYDYLLATRASNYAMIYTYNGLAMNVQLGKLSGKRIKASWFNPRTGETSKIGIIRNKGSKAFIPPGNVGEGNDFVLVLETL